MHSVASEIVQALGGRGAVCRCPAHDDKVSSLSVIDSDIDDEVIVTCFAGCDWRDVKAELRHLGLLPEWQSVSGDRFDPDRQARLATKRRKREKQAEKEKAEKIQWARKVWKESTQPPETPVQAYLGCRGIISPIPPTIRFHAGLRDSNTCLFFGTMVAAVAKWPSADVSGIHRTFLLPGGDDKAQISTPKKMAGHCAGGAVRLAPVGHQLIVTEGIETGLSVQQATGIPTWAALSTSGIKSLVLPDLPLATHIIIGADNDTSGQGLKAAEIAAERWSLEGRRVRIALPPTSGTDFNDVLLYGGVTL
jgi:putative DNA primase/helicase